MGGAAARVGCLMIRADAGPVMGTGHVLRGLALAAAWQARGGDVVLISHDLPAALERRVREAGIAVHDPGARHPAPGDLAGTRNLASIWGAGALVLDGYHLDTDYQRGVALVGCPVLVLDDHNHLTAYHADLLLNQNHGANAAGYCCNPDCRLLLGAPYTLLRPEFLAARPRARSGAASGEAFRLLVTLGGSDVAELVPHLLSQLRGPNLDLTVAAGHSAANFTALSAWAAASPLRPRVLAAAEEMPRLMNRADLVLSGAGTTAWELAYLGVPALLVELAANQRPVAAALVDCGAALGLGQARACDPAHLAAVVQALREKPQQLQAMSAAGQDLIDGSGALRVVDALLGVAAEVPA